MEAGVSGICGRVGGQGGEDGFTELAGANDEEVEVLGHGKDTIVSFRTGDSLQKSSSRLIL